MCAAFPLTFVQGDITPESTEGGTYLKRRKKRKRGELMTRLHLSNLE